MSLAQKVHHEVVPNHALAAGLAGFKAERTLDESSPPSVANPQSEGGAASQATASEGLHVVPQPEVAPAATTPSTTPKVAEEVQAPSGEVARQNDRPRKQKPSYPARVANVERSAPVTAPVRREQQFEDMPLRALRFVDLCARVASQKESGIICRFILRDGNSTAVFTLSVVPTNRVRFTCRESSVSFAPIFPVGSELFQDEIYRMREPSPERSMATSVFQQVLEAIDVRMAERRSERNQGSQNRPQARHSNVR